MSRFLAARAALALSALLTFGSGPVAAVAAASPSPVPTPTNPYLNCANTSTGNTAITDLGAGVYQGEQGGMYPGGSNTAPGAYQSAGIQAGRSVVSLDASGNPSPSGKIVFLSIGMSNTSMEFNYFTGQEAADPTKSSAVVMVNGAQGGKDAPAWTSPTAATWAVVDQQLAASHVTDQQVEVVWLKQAIAFPTTDFETYGHQLQQDLSQITSNAAQRYPNLRQVFVTARSYGGYGKGLNPEPYAYYSSFSVKWFVAQSVANPSQRPWVGWGPYFWTDGTRGRADGLKWYCSDTVDGAHPSGSGLAKINTYMHSLFVGSVFTAWFTGSSVPVQPPPPSPVANPTPTGGSQVPVATAAPTHHAAAPTSGGNAAVSPPPAALIPLPAPVSKLIAAGESHGANWLILAVAVAAFVAGCAFWLVTRRRRHLRRRKPSGPVSAVRPALPPDAPLTNGHVTEPHVLAGTAPERRPQDGPPPTR
jgi:hypothetical protein